MSKIKIKVNYEGAINDPENIKQDFRKAISIILLAFLSSGVLSAILFFAYSFLT